MNLGGIALNVSVRRLRNDQFRKLTNMLYLGCTSSCHFTLAAPCSKEISLATVCSCCCHALYNTKLRSIMSPLTYCGFSLCVSAAAYVLSFFVNVNVVDDVHCKNKSRRYRVLWLYALFGSKLVIKKNVHKCNLCLSNLRDQYVAIVRYNLRTRERSHPDN